MIDVFFSTTVSRVLNNLLTFERIFGKVRKHTCLFNFSACFENSIFFP